MNSKENERKDTCTSECAQLLLRWAERVGRGTCA